MPPPPQVTTLRIAVLLLPPIQLLDLSPIDLFHMLSKQYLSDCSLPSPFQSLGLTTVSIHYVSEHGPPSSSSVPVLADLTASASLRVTHNFRSPEVQPGCVDIVFVPGPDPKVELSGAAGEFVRAHAEKGTVLMSVCTGVIVLARAGVLDGRAVTGPRALLAGLRREFPAIKWTERRWEVSLGGEGEGKGVVWTAGGITNGQDMVAEYLRGNFGRELAELVCAMADVGERRREYATGPAVEGMWWGWLLLRSWVGGLFSGGGRGGRKEREVKKV